MPLSGQVQGDRAKTGLTVIEKQNRFLGMNQQNNPQMSESRGSAPMSESGPFQLRSMQEGRTDPIKGEFWGRVFGTIGSNTILLRVTYSSLVRQLELIIL
jgi:hypothetical protein